MYLLYQVKILVRYVRNPYFDDHFDLRDPEQLAGKTLGLLSARLESPLKENAAVLGWAMYAKWQALKAALVHADQAEIPIDPKIVSGQLV